MKTREEKIEALSKAEKYALSHFNNNTTLSTFNAELYYIGKEISESLESDMWEPSEKAIYYDANFAYSMEGVRFATTERECDTLEEAERCLRNEQIQNRINSWIREENKKTRYKADYKDGCQGKYYPKFNFNTMRWLNICSRVIKNINQEACNKESGIKLMEMLNAGMIKDVPAKLEVD